MLTLPSKLPCCSLPPPQALSVDQRGCGGWAELMAQSVGLLGVQRRGIGRPPSGRGGTVEGRRSWWGRRWGRSGAGWSQRPGYAACKEVDGRGGAGGVRWAGRLTRPEGLRRRLMCRGRRLDVGGAGQGDRGRWRCGSREARISSLAHRRRMPRWRAPGNTSGPANPRSAPPVDRSGAGGVARVASLGRPAGP